MPEISYTGVYLISNIRQNFVYLAKKGKADLDSLGLGFSYSHPVSLYKKIIGSVANEENDIVFDFF